MDKQEIKKLSCECTSCSAKKSAKTIFFVVGELVIVFPSSQF